ncbi:Cell division control protein 7 [Elasticomyces elasticus]|nr:Cell division control protein 7 [Elasticomyces elasticus]KAK3622596.1 Cell division control protein 7 [Elasticomyces elasticus]KAK4905424.1 Cell division control protein 7 [Elasticomyces elasticus]
MAVHEDVRPSDGTEEETDEMDEEMGPLDDSGGTVSDEEEQEEVDEAVAEDIARFEASFKNITQRYRLINRIGEGTFSTVYKAEDLLYDHYDNMWDFDADKENFDSVSSTTLKNSSNRSQKPKFVAIKKIYVTSSPMRIFNELELLHDLKDCPNVCPLITAFRCNDQVIAVLPYFQHQDFREYYRDFTVSDMRLYMHSLFTAMSYCHQEGIIHRDIKPTNFLYSPAQQRGVLVDFGLAEREGTEYHHCGCCYERDERARRLQTSVYTITVNAAIQAGQPVPKPAYPSNDQRSSRRANRAGTRGFRAPEVLLKCTAQNSQIDIWSCGIILLTFLSKRFPFFHSADDIDAFIELCNIFGKKKMRDTATLHGQMLQTNIPTLTENGHTWEKILLWCTSRGPPQGGYQGENYGQPQYGGNEPNYGTYDSGEGQQQYGNQGYQQLSYGGPPTQGAAESYYGSNDQAYQQYSSQPGQGNYAASPPPPPGASYVAPHTQPAPYNSGQYPSSEYPPYGQQQYPPSSGYGPPSGNADAFKSHYEQPYGPVDPTNALHQPPPGMPPLGVEGDRGVMGALAGGAAGAYGGHKMNHGFLGGVGGAVAGSMLEDAYKKRNKKDKPKKDKRRGSRSSSSSLSSDSDDDKKKKTRGGAMAGNFSASSRGVHLEGSTLVSECCDSGGHFRGSRLDLNDCFTNSNGQLRWARNGAFAASSRGMRFVDDGAVLEAELGDGRGGWQKNRVYLNERITNDDGRLHLLS